VDIIFAARPQQLRHTCLHLIELASPLIPEFRQGAHHLIELASPLIPEFRQGAHHSLVLRDDGTVLAFGMNEYGQLGDGSTEESREPVKVSGLPGPTKSVAAVSALTPPPLSRHSPSHYSKRCRVDGAQHPHHVEECRQ
jgi:hypothetical protein